MKARAILAETLLLQISVGEKEEMWLFIYLLTGPALFRGRLNAFGKCTNGVAFSKGRPNLASVRLTL